MIHINVKKHSKLSIEFKTSISIDKEDKKKKKNEFMMNTWFFIPNSININSDNYHKEDFYRDVRTNLRLITPVFTLDEIASLKSIPFSKLYKATNALIANSSDKQLQDDFDYHIRMIMCIIKSALRRQIEYFSISSREYSIKEAKAIAKKVLKIRDLYRSLKGLIINSSTNEEQINYFIFGDEFLGNLIKQHATMALRAVNKKEDLQPIKEMLIKIVRDEDKYKLDNNYMNTQKGDNNHNSIVLAQRNMLKNIMESDLFLKVAKKIDGAFIRQFYYGFAAAIAMLFATLISFMATQRYGNFTFDLLVVLVVSYVFKDRIKEVMRYYFTNNLSKKYFDTRTSLSIRNREIGEVKEAFDFIVKEKVPDEILHLRRMIPLVKADAKIFGEQIFQYRKYVKLSSKDLERYKEYSLTGINDISRFEFHNFTQKMDDPTTTLFDVDDNLKLIEFTGSRVYPIYVFFKCVYDTSEYNRAYRILLNREGITEMKELL